MADDLTGSFVWQELLTSDPDAAQPFYKSLIGWETSLWEEGEQPYTMWMKGEVAVGGLMTLPDEAKAMGAPPHWLSYIGTPQVDATVEKAKGLGAKPLFRPDGHPQSGPHRRDGRPPGRRLCDLPAGGGGAPPGDAVMWHELATTDFAAAFDFYQALFGLEKGDAMDMAAMGASGIYQIIKHGGQDIGGIFNKPAEMPGPSAWTVYFSVNDVDGAAPRAKELGGQVLAGPMDVPDGRIAHIMDPQGAVFALHSGGTSGSG